MLARDDERAPYFVDATSFIRGGDRALAVAEDLLARGGDARLEDFDLAAPMLPSTILLSGSNYTEHNREKANTPISGKEPEFFVKTQTA